MKPWCSFRVDGLPETKGSWRAVGNGRMKRDNPREKAWADGVGWVARATMRGKLPLVSALVAMDFILPPNVGNKNKRDIDKLARSILDAMNGIVYIDDENVRDLIAHKETSAIQSIGVEVNVYVPLGVRAADLVQFWIDQHDELRRV